MTDRQERVKRRDDLLRVVLAIALLAGIAAFSDDGEPRLATPVAANQS